MMTNYGFDDDLVAATAVNEEAFTKSQIAKARIASFMSAGALLIMLSFIIKV